MSSLKSGQEPVERKRLWVDMRSLQTMLRAYVSTMEEEEKRKRKGKHERIMNEWDELQEEERLFRQYKKHKLRWARGTGVRRSEEEYEKRLLEDDDGSEEEDTLEKAWKDHQMMRNSRKMRRAKGGKNKIFNK